MEQSQDHDQDARQRSTKEELRQRQEKACDLLAEGWPSHSVVKKLATEFSVTEQQARSYVRSGRQLLIEAVGVEDRASMFAQVLSGLQQDRMDARKAENLSAAVGASKAMVQLLKQLRDIDPMRDFENALIEAHTSDLLPGKKIPRVKVGKDGSNTPF